MSSEKIVIVIDKTQLPKYAIQLAFYAFGLTIMASASYEILSGNYKPVHFSVMLLLIGAVCLPITQAKINQVLGKTWHYFHYVCIAFLMIWIAILSLVEVEIWQHLFGLLIKQI